MCNVCESKVGTHGTLKIFLIMKDLKWANAILDCVNEMKDLNEESHGPQISTEIVFEENCSECTNFC